MSKVVKGLYYTNDDEWLRLEGNVGTVGITDYAQDALSDIVYLELPGKGDTFSMGEAFGVVESVKAAADLTMPATGVVTEVNDALVDTPEALNHDPYGSWLIKIEISDPSEIQMLMDAPAYEANLAERE
jgi:glycine cleavage system H protein